MGQYSLFVLVGLVQKETGTLLCLLQYVKTNIALLLSGLTVILLTCLPEGLFLPGDDPDFHAID